MGNTYNKPISTIKKQKLISRQFKLFFIHTMPYETNMRGYMVSFKTPFEIMDTETGQY